jgi:hypothetical protein
VADHLSRLQVKGDSLLPIDDYLWDDTLLKVTTLDPWYTNIVNFMVARYVPPRENKKKLLRDSHCHLWDDQYLYRVCSDRLLFVNGSVAFLRLLPVLVPCMLWIFALYFSYLIVLSS